MKKQKKVFSTLDAGSKNKTNSQIIERISAENPKAKTANGVLRGLTCPVCGEKEAYTYMDNPAVIFCPSENKCGKHSKTSDLYPELYISFLERYGRKGKKAAEAYLRSRGLDPATIKFG